MKYVGIDVHKTMCQAAILDEDGELFEETGFVNTPEGIERFAERLKDLGEVQAVLESAGNLWIQVHDRLEEHGIPVALSSPANSRLISDSRLKTDRTDVRALARLHHAGVLSTCYVPGAEERNRRELLRHRLRLVKMSNMAIEQDPRPLRQARDPCPVQDEVQQEGCRVDEGPEPRVHRRCYSAQGPRAA